MTNPSPQPPIPNPQSGKTGTREWAPHSVNCVTGCSHDCRYCYARAIALHWRRIKTPGEWATMRVRDAERRKARKKRDGGVMFPTTHDITPEVLPACIDVIGRLLAGRNRVLLVTKPHLSCVKTICRQFAAKRDQILWRFTITAFDDKILSYWEPGAPALEERFDALQYACQRGFATSVSMEPLLEYDRVDALIRLVRPAVTDSIWIGKMREIRRRCTPGTDPEAIARIEACQTDEAVIALYERYRDDPLIRWKDSFREVVGKIVGSG